MTELKPCKCKRKDFGAYVSGLWFENGFGWCVCCDGCGRQTPIYRDKQQAIDAWNFRNK